jgi:hypothetical protein
MVVQVLPVNSAVRFDCPTMTWVDWATPPGEVTLETTASSSSRAASPDSVTARS